ncbi:type II secretion system protein N, partial [Sphingomonas sp. AOB5]|uniref:type II secretion system protein N n=1 Tax=Sphingomonas sp. AOB5 TaxID=3034017 RepID=UPI0023F714DB
MITLPSLSPRQTRTALDLLTGAVVISVAFAMAGLTWRLAGHAGTGAIMAPSGKTAPGAAPDIAPVLALAPFGKAAISDATQPTTLALVLQGGIASDQPSVAAAFISVNNEPAAPFQIGDTVAGAKIEGILRDRVILSNGGRTEYLGFPVPVPEGAPAGAAGPGAPTSPTTAPPPPPTNRPANMLDGP